MRLSTRCGGRRPKASSEISGLGWYRWDGVPGSVLSSFGRRIWSLGLKANRFMNVVSTRIIRLLLLEDLSEISRQRGALSLRLDQPTIPVLPK
jgi:hypothetical protein